MTEDEFRHQLATQAYDSVRTLIYEPHAAPPMHAHEFSAMGMVTSGELTLVFEGGPRSFGPGESYEVVAGTQHAEHTGDAGAVALLGTRTEADRHPHQHA